MAKNLVIVESPTKVKTIEKILGKDYKVMSSHGHIRDLKRRNLSIDVDNGYEPIYEIPADKKNIVSELKKAAKTADTVWLASDEDLEGEAIAWHLAEVLGLDVATTHRIVFHEITPDAILHAIENPRTINLDRVDAQQARRVLDRIVGFELSPVLWRKIKPSLSAGRVQSVALRLIAERENEIERFVSEPYYRVRAEFLTPSGGMVNAELNKRLADEAQAKKFLDICSRSSFSIKSVNKRPTKKTPAPPFTTSTLQQEAARKLSFPVGMTMRVAQSLYEAGLITYMRTDSLNLSQMAIASISEEIKKEWGAEYLKNRVFHTSTKGAQEAHEAIRPTYINNRHIDGTPQEQKLYDLIWKRAVASQMSDAVMEKTSVVIEVSEADENLEFHTEGEVVKFDGFLKLYLEGTDDEQENENEKSEILPPMQVGERLNAQQVVASERFTQQPPRYNEGSLVKKLEELGIGRPSTYASIIQTIIDREYVERGNKEGVKRDYKVLTLTDGRINEETRSEKTGSDKGKLIPTDTGRVVNEYLTQTFPSILDYNFTAKIESRIDEIASGQLPWSNEIDAFYKNFHPAVDAAMTARTDHKVGERLLGNVPQTGEPVYVKIGRFGPMVQIGSSDGEEKPRFASLLKGQSMSSITLEDALKLFDFPRVIGEIDGKDVTVGIGRFGPYVRYDGSFVSIPKEIPPASLTIDEARELIESKQDKDRKKIIKNFSEEGIQILNGNYGPYIKKGRVNYKIPNTVSDPASLGLDDVKTIIENQSATSRKTSTSKRSSAGRKSKEKK